MVYKYKQLTKVFEVFGALLFSLPPLSMLLLTMKEEINFGLSRGQSFNEQELYAKKK